MEVREEIYITCRKKAMVFLWSHVERWEDAEDLCGDVFEQIYRSLPRFNETKASLSTRRWQLCDASWNSRQRKKGNL